MTHDTTDSIEERRSAAVWMVCVEGWDGGRIYSVHTDRVEADETARKLGHQFSSAYVTVPCRMGLDLPEPNEGEAFWHIYDGEAVPLTEIRSDDGFEDDVDYGAVLRREIEDGIVVSAPSAEAALAIAAKGVTS